ncbi:hypothetical protein LTR36_005208 [Oleoguttula mirabilis]|uniref:Uncharacterized protein n=1 Tax=Oleoguttula mirabilis TaxID=1507867 RepID=A0AAV9JWK7_9PEZI|nr:hypothetical protein LTR36_005208 [Oleoguttula mirabilis]
MPKPEDEQDGRCPLLELSAELRNRIYEMALVSGEEVVVTRQSFAEPALIKSCHQIRDETLQVYYEQHNFALDAPSFDSTVAVRWTAKAQKMAMRKGIWNLRTLITYNWPANWRNVMLWLRRYHCGETLYAFNIIGVHNPNQEQKIWT